MLLPSPEVFDERNTPEDTRKLNEEIIATSEAAPDMWQFDVNVVRQARRDGKGIFPLEAYDETAENFHIDGPSGEPLMLRTIQPESGRDTLGVFLHFHGGGWMYGACDLQDQRLKQLANETNLSVVSVEYRLSPENPYPAACDDGEQAARWLIEEGADKLNTDFLAIGGESAGGHLAVNALLRLRDKHSLNRFSAAVLVAGAFDMTQTPSGRNFHDKLVLTTRDINKFGDAFLVGDEVRGNLKDPDLSPLYADLTDMPPAHFSVGTRDALLDDSLFMANKWVQHQPDVELDVYTGACHVFQYFETLKQSQESRKKISDFLNRLISNS